MGTEVEIQKPESRIETVKTIWDADDANVLISKGWTVMHAGVAHRTETGLQAKPCFILAYFKD